MLWFTVWSVLVVGTVVGAFLLLRHLYRSGKALLVEVDRAAELLDTLSTRADELADVVAAAHPVAPVDLRDPTGARARHAQAAEATARRRARRDERRAATYRRWLSFSR